jgi:hypothetical protein
MIVSRDLNESHRPLVRHLPHRRTRKTCRYRQRRRTRDLDGWSVWTLFRPEFRWREHLQEEWFMMDIGCAKTR